MKKKGFTLAEMLGVITILAVLGLLVFPAVEKSLKDGKEDLHRVQINNIENAALTWTSDNAFKSPDKPGETMLLTLYQLKQAGKIDNDIIDPVTKNLFPDDLTIKITATASDYKAEVVEDSGNPTNDKKYNPLTPDVKINGKEFVYLEYKKNSTQAYADPGVTALSSTGASISDITSAIKDENGNIVLNITYGRMGTYNIFYDVTSDNITVRVIRTVIVKDSKGPVITLPSTTTVSRSNAASYNLISTITVTDESEYTVTPDRTNLPSVAGTYTITYTATDAYGNTSQARRTIIVN